MSHAVVGTIDLAGGALYGVATQGAGSDYLAQQQKVDFLNGVLIAGKDLVQLIMETGGGNQAGLTEAAADLIYRRLGVNLNMGDVEGLMTALQGKIGTPQTDGGRGFTCAGRGDLGGAASWLMIYTHERIVRGGDKDRRGTRHAISRCRCRMRRVATRR